jgi:hypothetical protein
MTSIPIFDDNDKDDLSLSSLIEQALATFLSHDLRDKDMDTNEGIDTYLESLEKYESQSNFNFIFNSLIFPL